MDPIALTLAVWLGLVTCGVGVTRLAEDASSQAALAQVRAEASAGVEGLERSIDAMAPPTQRPPQVPLAGM